MTVAEDLLYHKAQFVLSDFGFNMKTLVLIVFFGLLIAIAVIDSKTMTIPLALNGGILLLGLISAVSGSWDIGIVNRLVGIISVSLPMILIVLLVPDGFGWGDIKMMAASGFFLGWITNLVSFFIALVLGGLWGAVLLVLRKKGRKDHFAFGPFLCAGMVLAIFFGDAMIRWYFSLGKNLYNIM